jgi:ribosomal protein S18 acetylase RimI-like enzyme
MERENDVVQIRVATPAQQVEALWLLNEPLDEPLRRSEVAAVVQAVASGESSLDYLFVALRGDTIVGVVYGSPLPGGVGIVKAAQLLAGESSSLAVELHGTLEEALRIVDIDILQTLVDVRWTTSIKRLGDAGFDKTAYLKYLLCESEQFPDVAPSLPFSVQHYQESHREQLIRLIDRTYRETKDFPVLNGRRDVDDVLVGYQETGRFVPERWLLFEEAGELCGCVLLTEHPDKLWELVYMGIVPEKRGKRWGVLATRWGQWYAHQQGCRKMILAVDADNEPAVRMYAESGFSELDSRFVMLKFI